LRRSGSAGLFVALLAATALAACGDPSSPTGGGNDKLEAFRGAGKGWVYEPAEPETRKATGGIEVAPGVDKEGPIRTIHARRGVATARLVRALAAEDWINQRTLREALAAPPDARPILYAILDDRVLHCDDMRPSHLVWYEPEVIERRTLVLGVLGGGGPGDANAGLCQVLRYTRAPGESKG
jgi:hypothetical protein